jgi:membrane protein YqaA with SNARE-associated domain
MKAQTQKLYTWATEKAASSRSPLWLALLFSLELFLIVPLDAVLLFFCSQNPRKTFLYVTLATLTSTLSGLAGYLFGHLLWDLIGPYLVPSLIPASAFDRFASHFQLYEHWAVFFGTLLPFPLKALSLASGVFHIGLLPFLTYMFFARLLRFSLSGIAMILWGPKVKTLLDKYHHHVFLALGIKTLLAAGLFWLIAK